MFRFLMWTSFIYLREVPRRIARLQKSQKCWAGWLQDPCPTGGRKLCGSASSPAQGTGRHRKLGHLSMTYSPPPFTFSGEVPTASAAHVLPPETENLMWPTHSFFHVLCGDLLLVCLLFTFILFFMDLIDLILMNSDLLMFPPHVGIWYSLQSVSLTQHGNIFSYAFFQNVLIVTYSS
jgi:hypothetical protein